MRALRPGMLALLVGYCALLVLALLSPTATLQSGVVWDLSAYLLAHGAPAAWTTYGRLEMLLNVAIVAPVTFLASGVTRALSWRDWTAFAFVGSAAVELVQGAFFPERQASFSDVVANTGGALCGAVLFSVLVGWWLDRSGRRRRGEAQRTVGQTGEH